MSNSKKFTTEEVAKHTIDKDWYVTQICHVYSVLRVKLTNIMPYIVGLSFMAKSMM
jgi:hypothetical protein